MSDIKKIRSALISVYNKDGLEPIVKKLDELGVEVYSTGGTQQFIESLGVKAIPVEQLTSYPSILGGRVKTLHPKVFGGILSRREVPTDILQLEEYNIPEIDLVIVDLYPFEETVASGAGEQDIIEKIDIGGISLIRAAAKNYKDVLVIASKEKYGFFLKLLSNEGGSTALSQRKALALEAFNVTSHYDTMIYKYFESNSENASAYSIHPFKQSICTSKKLRYGENPHQGGIFHGNLDDWFEILNGKELSYNNLLDIDAAVNLISEFATSTPTFAILKHNNPCGVASRPQPIEAWRAALAGDTVSAFGGIIISNKAIDAIAAAEINKLFFEILITPGIEDEALDLLKQKKNRIILRQKKFSLSGKIYRTVLGGIIEQDRDTKTESKEDFKTVTKKFPSGQEVTDLIFGSKICKHTKSNSIVLAKNEQLIGSGMGQASRVDALRQAIAKARSFGFELTGSVMLSDAFFPFPDCVEIAHKAGISALAQPGGSIRDNESIEYCDRNNIAMAFTGIRHFRH